MSLGFVLLAIYLILTGLIAVFNFTFDGIGLVMGLLALAAGVLLLLGDNLRGKGRFRWSVGPGILLLAIYLILTGLASVFGFSFEGMGLVMGLLALAAGVVLLFRR